MQTNDFKKRWIEAFKMLDSIEERMGKVAVAVEEARQIIQRSKDEMKGV